MRKYVIKKSIEPDEEGDHIVLLESESKSGFNYGRVFKGTKQECIEKKKELEEIYESER